MAKETKAQSKRPVPAHSAVEKGEGDGPVQQWIGLLPGWQSTRAAEIDRIVTEACPDIVKAVKWHGAWYGMPGGGWTLAVGALTSYLKLVLHDGDNLTPPPPVFLKAQPARALDLYETDPLDAAQLAGWITQAQALPGWGKT